MAQQKCETIVRYKRFCLSCIGFDTDLKRFVLPGQDVSNNTDVLSVWHGFHDGLFVLHSILPGDQQNLCICRLHGLLCLLLVGHAHYCLHTQRLCRLDNFFCTLLSRHFYRYKHRPGPRCLCSRHLHYVHHQISRDDHQRTGHLTLCRGLLLHNGDHVLVIAAACAGITCDGHRRGPAVPKGFGEDLGGGDARDEIRVDLTGVFGEDGDGAFATGQTLLEWAGGGFGRRSIGGGNRGHVGRHIVGKSGFDVFSYVHLLRLAGQDADGVEGRTVTRRYVMGGDVASWCGPWWREGGDDEAGGRTEREAQ
mmetsp:Transcript_22550/g.51622  ORF Transcript_22550/g.51622 Transcript_22550/m.51622 type:complete len:308 (+) Transcript_22550:287-1210(+)